MPIATLTVANTFNDWMATTNTIITTLNTPVVQINQSITGNVTIVGTVSMSNLVVTNGIDLGTI